MPHEALEHAEGLVHRISGDSTGEVLVYLPGVHGDWTPFGPARVLLNPRRRLIEVAYPRQPLWTLEDFAAGLRELLDELGVESAHVIGESFGSLVGWSFGLAHPERVRSFTLVGGFCRAPAFSKARLAKWGLRMLPTALLEAGIDFYVDAKHRQGRVFTGLSEASPPYPASRTSRGRLAVSNRMHIIQEADFRDELHRVRFPVNYLGGARDTMVPVRRELKTLQDRLPAECELRSHLIPRASHMILSTHAPEAAERILEWTAEPEAVTRSVPTEPKLVGAST